MPSVLTGAPLRQPAPPGDLTPRGIVRSAVAAVEGDSINRVRLRWAAAVSARPGSRPQALGLATLDRITYRYPEAEAGYRALVATGQADQWTAAAWLGLGLASFPHGSLVEAEKRYRQAIAAARAAAHQGLEAEGLIGLAVVTARLTSADSALRILDQAATTLSADDPWLKASYLCRRAGIEGNLGRQGARVMAAEGFSLAAQLGDERLAAGCQTAIGILHSQRGATDSAFAALVAAARTQIRLHDLQGWAISIQWQASIRAAFGSLSLAASAIRSALIAADSSGNQAAKAWALVARSTVATAVRDFPLATAALTEAEAIFRATGDRSGLLSALTQRGTLIEAQGDPIAAERVFREALPAAGQFYGVWRVNILRRLGHYAGLRGAFREADSTLLEARRVAQSLGLAGQLLGLEFDRAQIAIDAGNFAEARRGLLSQLRRSGNYTPFVQHSQYLALAGLELAANRVAAAESLMVKGTDALEQWRNRLTDAQFRLQTFAVADNATGTQFANLAAGLIRAGRIGAAFDLIERRRARLLLDRLAAATAIETDSVALASVRRNRTSIGKPLSIAAVQAALPPRTALLLFVTGGKGTPSGLIVVWAGDRRGYLVPSSDSLVGQINRFGKLLESGLLPDTLASQLGAALLGPALADLPPEVERLIVIPDGPIHRLPLDVLRIDGRLLLERFTVTTAPSASIAVRTRPASPPRPAAILSMGDPAFTQAPDQWAGSGFERSERITRLLGSGAEAKRVGRYSSRSVIRTGRTASEAALKQLDLGTFTVLHFATHALIDEQAARSALVLAAGDGDDGFVTPTDLARRRLRADLVVLSACRTARGAVVSGEGIQGLTAPLLESGARAVIATLWPVEDRGTEAFVRLLYDAMASGVPVAEALQQAKLAARTAGLSPREWASFGVVGDGTTVVRIDPPVDFGRRRWILAVSLLAATVAVMMPSWRRPA